MLQLFSCGAMLVLLSLTTKSTAQVTTNFAVGTTTSSYVPIYGYYNFSYTEQIYLASDFDVAVQGQLNQITTVRFYLDGTNLTNVQDWTIYMGETSQTSYSSNTDWITSNGMNQVYTGIVSSPAAAGWIEVILDTPFTWDGTSNVVVGFDQNQTGYTNNINWRTNSTGPDRSIYYRADGTNPDPASPPSASGRVAYVPQMQFEHLLASPCAGSPAAPTLTASSNSVCVTGDVDFEVQSTEFVSGLNIVWQYDLGSGWVDFTNSTSTTTFTANVTQSMDVRALYTCANSGLSTPSNVEAVTVYSNPTVIVDVTEAAYCSSAPVDITASGAAIYTWSPAAGLNSSTLATVSASPTANTTYTVVGTDINGCSSTATSVISPLSEVQTDVTVTPGAVCSSGTPITLNTALTPSTLAAGTWEYRFLDTDGTTVLQDWSASTMYTFTPGADSIYTYFTQARNTGCADVLDSVATTITVGFGADVTTIDYDCNNLGGSIMLANAFGQSATQSIYADVLDGTNTADFTFSGSGGFDAGRAVITPSATSQNGYMDVAIPGFTAGINNAMTVSFDLTADMPINVYGTGGADGIAYSFGNDASATGSGPANNGRGTKLRLSFDAANNGANAPAGIYLAYGYTGSTDLTTTAAGVLAYSSNLASWKLLTDTPVEMVISENGLVTVTVGGTVVFNNVALPASYKTEDVSTWKHLFSARTGGDALRQAVSNLEVTAPTIQSAIVANGVTPTAADFGIGSTATGLQPGLYDVWLAQDETNMCSNLIGTYEVLNTNPIVDLGNDTTICAGTSIVLDAGNAGATYVWSGTTQTTQTISVSNSGTYVAYATAANSCVGIGTINVQVLQDPTVDGVYSQGTYQSMSLSAMNPQNVSTYDWDFGDGTTAMNGPSSLSHTYPNAGTYTVTLTVTNACGTITITETIEANSTVGIDENEMVGVSIYPNPAHGIFTIETPEETLVSVNVYSATGAMVQSISEISGTTSVDVQGWQRGIYFVQIQSADKITVKKLVVE